jgi:hypothetical protein
MPKLIGIGIVCSSGIGPPKRAAMKRPILLAVTMLAVTACANPGIVQLSPDTYMLSRVDKGGVFGNAAAMKASVIQQANDFAASKGKVAIPISTHEEPVRIGQFASFDYQFKLVAPDKAKEGLAASFVELKQELTSQLESEKSPAKRLMEMLNLIVSYPG